MQTIVLDDFGTYLGKRSERAVVKHADGTEEEFLCSACPTSSFLSFSLKKEVARRTRYLRPKAQRVAIPA